MNGEPIEKTSLHEAINRKDDKGNFILSPLPYADDYLEPYIGSRTVEFHYSKHLSAYINKVNSLKGEYPDNTIEELIEHNYTSVLYNNASQVFNHYFYFEQLNPKGAKQLLPAMGRLVESNFGSLDNLKSQMTDAGLSLFGSGWVYLTTDKDRKSLWIKSFTGAGTPIDEIPLLTIDVWEHAYYLDYQNDRKMYIEKFFEAIDWAVVEKRLCGEIK